MLQKAIILILISTFGLSCNDSHKDDQNNKDKTKNSKNMGGRLYDNLFVSLKTPLPKIMKDKNGEVIENTGHDFRCKNCHGWDYKGNEGIYGPDYQNKPYAASVNLIQLKKDDNLSLKKIMDSVLNGHGIGMPVYSEFLNEKQAKLIAEFLVTNAHDSSYYFDLKTNKTNKYELTLVNLENKEKASVNYTKHCESCHGKNGAKFLLHDGEYTLGSHSRQKAYEDHHKIQNGSPGSDMMGYLNSKEDILGMLGYLCDSNLFLSGGTKSNENIEKESCGPNYK